VSNGKYDNKIIILCIEFIRNVSYNKKDLSDNADRILKRFGSVILRINIRKASGKDIPRLIALLEQVAAVHHIARPDIFKTNSKKYNETDLEALLCDKKVFIFVATNEDDIAAGYIFCMVNEYKDHPIMQDGKTLYIDDLCVDATKRGSGIGKMLFEHACAYAREQGCNNVTLNVWNGNDTARRFYENLGMTEQKRTLEMRL
jgi:ribosomal protein S18 acetylase RimI-like enzyme